MHAPPLLREDVEREDETLAEPCAGEAPPTEDCSAGDVSRPVADDASNPADAANHGAEASYKTLEEMKAEARRLFLRPAQREQASRNESPEGGEHLENVAVGNAAEESELADHVRRGPPNHIASDHAGRPLSRRERRARQRQLERLRKKR